MAAGSKIVQVWRDGSRYGEIRMSVSRDNKHGHRWLGIVEESERELELRDLVEVNAGQWGEVVDFDQYPSMPHTEYYLNMAEPPG